MFKGRTTGVAIAAATVLVLAACGNSENGASGGDSSEENFVTDFTMGTGGTGGTFYPLGGELAAIFEDNVEGISVSAVETGGGTDNLGQLYQGNHQIGMSSNDITNMAVKGELEGLEGETMDNIAWIAQLYPEAVHVIVREDSGIESIADLEGTRVAVGNAGSGTRVISDAILEAYGLSEGDYTPEITDFSSSASMLADNQVDASIFVVGPPAAGLTQLAATTDVTLLPIEEDMAAELSGDSYLEPYTVSAETYDFLEEDLPTLSVFAALLASTEQLSEDVAYDLTAALYDNAGDITLSVGESIKLEQALAGIGDVPLHPGAARYYEEQGIDLP